MGIRTFLSEDPNSPPLNTEAHAVEHCAVDPQSLGALGSAVGRQLLIRRASDRLALYTQGPRDWRVWEELRARRAPRGPTRRSKPTSPTATPKRWLV